MKLYELKRDTIINCDLNDGSKWFVFDHIDGAYSYCVTANDNIFHLSAFTEIELKDNKYYLKESQNE